MAKALLDICLKSRYLCCPRTASSGQSLPMQTFSRPSNNCFNKAVATVVLQLSCILWSLPVLASGSPSPKNNSSEPAKIMFSVAAPESDVLAAVQQVTQDQIIHGTYSYDKERILYGAHSAKTAHAFGTWSGSGTVFYKVANNILSPRYFKDTNDIGTISVRYVVQSAGADATIVRIDSVFVDARNSRHESLGNVEASEYSAIQQHLQTIQGRREAATEKSTTYTAASAVPSATGSRVASSPAITDSSAPDPVTYSVPAMQKHVDALRHEVELRVKDQGAQLKSAPFHSAATLESLPGQSEVLIVVLTPYWYGVETEEGHRGWVHHSQLEPLP